MVWTLSKLTTQSEGTPSSAAVRSSSETSPRRVRVSAATTTAPMRSATGSRVRTSTGRSPPGVAANQISPLRIGPVGPVFCRTPIGDGGECALALAERLGSPRRGVVFAGQTYEVATESLTQQFGAFDAQPLRPRVGGCRVRLVDAEAEHRRRHTISVPCMTVRGI